MQTEFTVKGMHCVSCKNLIEEDLGEMPGVRGVLVDLNGGRAHIDYDEQTVTPKLLMQKIGELGYHAEVAAATGKTGT
jgi:copper chaperone CopZ